ncbi:MAG: redoxin domain-containing protein [Chloracidobacterium sp.]|nr:redoxin domain-containing protein [Chloracidobacterium sp.]
MNNPIGLFLRIAVCAALVVLAPQPVVGQTKPGESSSDGPKVLRIDVEGLRKLLSPTGRPLVVNFWATWCDPCREEFPDLVKLYDEYRGRVDLVTVSLDDTVDIGGNVTKFLTTMRAEMPAYLLDAADPDAAIKLVSKDWAGNLPLTLVYATDGSMVYFRNGKFRNETLKENIDRALGGGSSGNGPISVVEFIKVKGGKRDEARYFYENNWRAYRDVAAKRGVIESFEYIEIVAPHNAAFDIILITRYKDAAQFTNSEKAFGPIMKELRPKGPLLKGTFAPDEFREIVYSYTARSVFPVM